MRKSGADDAARQLTYPEVGATAGVMPSGYRTLDVTQPIGRGQEWFETAAQRVLSWDMHRRAGLLVHTDQPHVAAHADAVLELRLGPWWMRAPVRVVTVVREPTTQGFAYGTLPGHPECGEERFLVHIDADQLVTAQIRAFSRPGRWFTRLGRPIARRVQNAITQRYLDALIQPLIL